MSRLLARVRHLEKLTPRLCPRCGDARILLRITEVLVSPDDGPRENAPPGPGLAPCPLCGRRPLVVRIVRDDGTASEDDGP
jgi:hypothetical protein